MATATLALEVAVQSKAERCVLEREGRGGEEASSGSKSQLNNIEIPNLI